MNIDISNAHCGPRIQFPDHAWLRVVLTNLKLLAPSRKRTTSHGVAVNDEMSSAVVAVPPSHCANGVRAIVGRSPEVDASLCHPPGMYYIGDGSTRRAPWRRLK